MKVKIEQKITMDKDNHLRIIEVYNYDTDSRIKKFLLRMSVRYHRMRDTCFEILCIMMAIIITRLGV